MKSDCEEDESENCCWSFVYQPRENRINPIPVRMEDPEVTLCGLGAVITHEFSFPGDFEVCAYLETAPEERKCAMIMNRYVHRDISDLTDQEFDDFANALNKVKELSTEEGRAQYGSNCMYDDTDFYKHDSFVALHTALSMRREEGDLLHFQHLMETAHQGWTSLLQKSIRCICRSCSHFYIDPIKDLDTHYDGTIESMYGSPVWGPDRMGGGVNSFEETDGDSPYYVRDGKFADFTVTQTKEPEYWCADMMELSGEIAYNNCVEMLSDNSEIFQVGLTVIRPMPDDHLEYVSRRPYHYMDTEHCKYRIDELRDDYREDVVNAQTLEQIWHTAQNVHLYGHDCVSGKWFHPDHPFDAASQWYRENVGVDTIEEVIDLLGYDSNQIITGLFTIVLGLDGNLNNANYGCSVCHDEYCECKAGSCDTSDPWWTITPDRSYSYETYARTQYYSLPKLQNMDCNWPRGGTFDWSASANQDPAFYPIHWYTFSVKEYGEKAFIARNGGSVIEYAETWDGLINDEKPGMKLYDESPFKNLIPYTVDGSEEHHTWHEILAYYASEEDFVFDFSHWPEIDVSPSGSGEQSLCSEDSTYEPRAYYTSPGEEPVQCYQANSYCLDETNDCTQYMDFFAGSDCCTASREATTDGSYTCGTTMEECEAAYMTSMTPAVTAVMATETVESCDSADGWWVSSTLNSLSGYDADTMSVCQMDGEYMIQWDGMIYPTCVAYGDPDTECSDSDLICPENPNNVGVFGYAGNQRSALASALTRNDFMHPICPTSTCKSMDERADSGSYWKETLMNNGFTDVAEDEADNVCVTEDNQVMFITSEGKHNTCLGWSATGTETCDSQNFICSGHDGQGLFTYGWPGQIARTLAKAVTSDNYMHPQCPLMICSA